MKKIIFILFIFSGLYAQCSEMDVMECGNDNNCEWLENIESVTCASLVLDEELCEAAPGCTYSCDDGGGYFGWCNSYCDGGMTYIDNGYCQDIEISECSEMNQLECNNNDYCEWELDIAYETCGQFSAAECNSVSGCYWDCSSWYTWICGCYGAWESDDSYCDELEYLNGDINFDWTINVLDIVELVDIILSGNSYILIGDTNSDGVNNVLDVILLVSLIIGD